MSDHAPVLEKTTISDFAMDALAACWDVYEEMPGLLVAAVLACLALRISDTYLDDWVRAQDSIAIAIGCSVLQFVAGIAVLSAIAVAVHRHVLLNETTTARAMLSSARTALFAGWTIAAQLVIAAAMFGAIAAYAAVAAFQAMPAVAIFSLLVVLVYPLIRPILLFPSVAIGETSAGPMDRLATAWRRGKGRFWTMFLAMLLTLAPLVGVFFVLSLIVSMFVSTIGLDAQSVVTFLQLFGGVASAVFTVAGVVLATAVVSVLYSAFVLNPSARTP